MNIYDTFLSISCALVLILGIGLALDMKEGSFLVIGLIGSLLLYLVTIIHSAANTPVSLCQIDTLKIVSKFSTEKYECFFYENESGQFVEARFSSFEEVSKIRKGVVPVRNYYRGQTQFGPDKEIIKIEIP